MKTPRINRRTVLRGAGAALALPWLEAMSPAFAGGDKAAEAPKRFAALFFPNGVRQEVWTPQETGDGYTLPRQLEPLASVKDDVSVVSGLWHQACNTGDGHYVKDAAWLTGTTITKTTGVNLNSGGISADQLAADLLGKQTPLPSMELGTEPVSSGVDGTVGYTRVYGAHIAWRTPTQPLAKEINPRLAFDRMTMVASGKADGRSNRPLLDRVSEEANSLRSKLGHNDRHRLDQYLESVRSLEKRLEMVESKSQGSWQSKVDFAGRTAPPSDPKDHAERTRLMLDMIALAFESDVTRVCTFMFGNSVSSINFAFLDGVTGSHHELSHHQGNQEKLAQYELIAKWHVAQYVYLLEKLRSIPEGESNVLDNSAILFGSALRDGNSHSPHDLPLLVGGKAGGRLKQGQHIAQTRDNPMSNLLLTLLQSIGSPATHFADSSGPIEQLLA
ncbi:DUF1552 domain-containing protein [Blastopirellula marina]|uniref:DUF1552 domain-containing protein n=1 Tax=Blastopirellula marina TaxID=124 RepID=A0A2S8FUG6_9BACT|nr:DUF1552 domain-containing protein [Blastopirellula marina]PQO35494.1 hypothetical protein C5Y98_14135 [Blastopirellula marina]PQO41332.1 hypothetical protein C5Y93_29900 [Blastopirellula marina]PTL44134.1 DUF1552 domain-containing protein [Blastopirellula marina]